jgi:hypothetical protein
MKGWGGGSHWYFNRPNVAFNESSLLLKIQVKNTQTAQLFMMNIKTENIYKRY